MTGLEAEGDGCGGGAIITGAEVGEFAIGTGGVK